MKLIVHEISDSVSQVVVPSIDTMVEVIRPHIYVHNKPVGTLRVQLCAADGEILTESEPVDIQTMTALPYFHGYIQFQIKAFLKKNFSYMVKVVSGDGYSFSESGYCGVCADFDLRKYDTLTPVTHPNLSPLDLEIWSLSFK